jgi:hypothetical protein
MSEVCKVCGQWVEWDHGKPSCGCVPLPKDGDEDPVGVVGGLPPGVGKATSAMADFFVVRLAERDKTISELQAEVKRWRDRCMNSDAEGSLANDRAEKSEAVASLMRQGIEDALSKETVEAMRIPLVGCTLKLVEITDADRAWAAQVLLSDMASKREKGGT